MTKRTPPYSPEVRARAVRMVLDHQGEHASQWAAISSIAAKIGCSGETLRNWMRQAERQGSAGGQLEAPTSVAVGEAPGRPTHGRARADQGAGAGDPGAAPGQRDPAQGQRVFCDGGARPPVAAMIAFIDEPSRRLRGRADLQGAADRSVDLPRPCRAARRSRQAAGTRSQ